MGILRTIAAVVIFGADFAVGTNIIDMMLPVVPRRTETAAAKLKACIELGEAAVAATIPDPVNLDAHDSSYLFPTSARVFLRSYTLKRIE